MRLMEFSEIFRVLWLPTFPLIVSETTLILIDLDPETDVPRVDRHLSKTTVGVREIGKGRGHKGLARQHFADGSGETSLLSGISHIILRH